MSCGQGFRCSSPCISGPWPESVCARVQCHGRAKGRGPSCTLGDPSRQDLLPPGEPGHHTRMRVHEAHTRTHCTRISLHRLCHLEGLPAHSRGYMPSRGGSRTEAGPAAHPRLSPPVSDLPAGPGRPPPCWPLLTHPPPTLLSPSPHSPWQDDKTLAIFKGAGLGPHCIRGCRPTLWEGLRSEQGLPIPLSPPSSWGHTLTDLKAQARHLLAIRQRDHPGDTVGCHLQRTGPECLAAGVQWVGPGVGGAWPKSGQGWGQVYPEPAEGHGLRVVGGA